MERGDLRPRTTKNHPFLLKESNIFTPYFDLYDKFKSSFEILKKTIIYFYFSSHLVSIQVIKFKILRMIYLRTFLINDPYRDFEPRLKEKISINIGLFVQ